MSTRTLPLGVVFALSLGASEIMGVPLVFADLRILATSDVHMHVTGWDALRDEVVAGKGMDVLANRIGAARKDAPGSCLLVDNGDALQGTPMGEVCSGWTNDQTHPWAAIVNALDYDAVGLGNHDFDFGIPFLETVVSQIKVPTLCASFASGGVDGVAATALLRRELTCSDGQDRPITIGVTSVLPPQTQVWNEASLTGKLSFHSGIDAARRSVARLRADGADVVLMLCHSGLTACPESEDTENFAADLARDIDGIDAMVMGHVHECFPHSDGPKDVHGVPAVMPGYGAQALGVMDLRLSWSHTGWAVADQSAALVKPQRQDTARPDITVLAAPAIQDTRAELDVPLGESAAGFHSYFDMLQSGMAGALVARAMIASLKARVADTELADLPMVASVAATALGGRIGPRNYVEVPAGTVRSRHVSMLTPFFDTVWGGVLTGAELRVWAERSAAFFASDVADKGYLVAPDAPSFNFDILHGLHTEIDPLRAPMFDLGGRFVNRDTQRVQALFHNGQPVMPDARFLVALTSYRAVGGGGFPGLGDSARVLRTTDCLKGALRHLIRTDPQAFAPAPSVWRLAPGRPIRVVIETSPNAQSHLEDIARFDPQVIGETADGFLQLDVAL